jgi:UDP:flavonoid glycosyltransferase YjiC (YdhE family)
MATIWCVSAPLYSHTDWGGFLKTAQALATAGHHVIWVSEASLAPAIEAAHLRFEAIERTGWLWPPPPTPDLSTLKPQEAVALRYTRALDTWLTETLVAEGAQNLLDLAARIGKPDAMLIDPFLSSAALAADALDVPMIVMGWPAQANLDEQKLFPVQRNLSSESQQRIQRLCETFGVAGRYFSKGAAPSIISPLLHVTFFTRGWYQAEEASLLPQTAFTGGLPEPAGVIPPWLADIPAEQPLALVTLGTTFTGDLGFYSWAAQAAARQGLLPIVAIGWNPIAPEKKEELKRALPPGTRLITFVPFSQVLPRCKLMIHHGGMGSTHHAVVHGVVQVVVPHAADQRIQATRVAQAKIGLHLSAHDVRQGLLREGVKALMEADWVQANARKLAAEMAALGGAPRAVGEIEHALGLQT